MSQKQTSTTQALIDMKAAGYPAALIDQLLEFSQSNNEQTKQAEKLFKSHLYPQKALHWIKYFNDVELEKHINSYTLQVFLAMSKNMRTLNLIQVSQNDIVLLTKLNKRTVSKALGELQYFGCIAIKMHGDNRNASVYMINPYLAIVGTGDQHKLKNEFWNLVSPETKSIFLNIVNNRTYSIGYGKQETDKETIYFNTINPPKVKTKKSPADDAADEQEDDLPI